MPAAPDRSWRERLQALRHLPKLLRMVWETNPGYVVGILLLRIARSVVPLAVLWVGKLIVDEVVHAISVTRRRRRLLDAVSPSCSASSSASRSSARD